MDIYAKSSYKVVETITKDYSTSFSISSRLFEKSIRPHIYAIYGMVRIADEIVDSYSQSDTQKHLDNFESQIYDCLGSDTHYSTNPVVFAFCQTANEFNITKDLIAPFFASMRLDINPPTFDQATHEKYIYGSAEVVGLMCLKAFLHGDAKKYNKLENGAKALGSSYQKVNFLRDIGDDYRRLGRCYFPKINPNSITQKDKDRLIKDIRQDFQKARIAINQLPDSSKRAVSMSYIYYTKLLDKLEATPAAKLTQQRVRIPNTQKLWLYAKLRLRLG